MCLFSESFTVRRWLRAGKGGREGGREEGGGGREVVNGQDVTTIHCRLTVSITTLPPKLLHHRLCCPVLLLIDQRPEGSQVATARVRQLGDRKAWQAGLEVHGGHLAVLDVPLLPVAIGAGQGRAGGGASEGEANESRGQLQTRADFKGGVSSLPTEI